MLLFLGTCFWPFEFPVINEEPSEKRKYMSVNLIKWRLNTLTCFKIEAPLSYGFSWPLVQVSLK